MNNGRCRFSSIGFFVLLFEVLIGSGNALFFNLKTVPWLSGSGAPGSLDIENSPEIAGVSGTPDLEHRLANVGQDSHRLLEVPQASDRPDADEDSSTVVREAYNAQYELEVMRGKSLIARKIVACIGDGITVGMCSSRHKSYPEILQSKLGDGYVVSQYAACGRAMSKSAKHPIWNETSLLDSAISSKPDIVVMMFGTSDAKEASFADLEYKETYSAMIKLFQGLKSRVYIVSPPPVYDAGMAKMNITASNVNMRLPALTEDIARENGLSRPIDVFGDYKTACPDVNGTCSLMTHTGPSTGRRLTCKSDSVHPNDDGNDHIAQMISDTVLCETPANALESGVCAFKQLLHRLGVTSRL